MAAIDKTKELIGWLKVTFALLIAIDASLIGWLVQHFGQTNDFLLLSTIITLVLVNGAIVIVSRYTYLKINEIGEL